MEKKRYYFIDALRGLAILAVVMDHTYQLIYTSDKLHHLTYFSVTLFVLVAGVNAFLSMSRRKIEGYDTTYVKSRLIAILVPYLIATAFCTWVNGNKHFDLTEFVKTAFLFNSCPTFYFVFFFLQLILLSPVLFLLVRIIFTKKKNSLVINTGIIVCVILTAYLCTEYTTMLELHGGARYLLGSSYLIVYFGGMILGALLMKKRFDIKGKIAACVAATACICYMSGILLGFVQCDKYAVIYDKWAMNPPGLRLGVYALCIYISFWGLYEWLEEKGTILLKILRPLEVCGKYSLNIFLYHLYFIIILRNTLFIWKPITQDNIWLRRLCVLVTGVVVPVIFKVLYIKIKNLLLQKKDVILKD